MTALDTNVILRFLLRDDAAQSQAVRALFKRAEAARERFHIPVPVLLETLWVLEKVQDMPRADIIRAIEDLRRMTVLEFESDPAIERALADARHSQVDLADILIGAVARANGCTHVLTFDRRASRLPSFRLLS